MQALYDGVDSGGLDVGGVNFVTDTVDGFRAISLDGTAPVGATPSAYTEWSDGGYIVLEGAHPISGVWQARVEVTGSNTDLFGAFSWRGGWANATEFGSVATTVSGNRLWNTGNLPGAGFFLEMSAISVDEPYSGSGTLLTALALRQVSAADACAEALLCGGIYQPVAEAISLDTHPAAMMAGIPHANTTSNNRYWARRIVDLQSRGPIEYAHTTPSPREVWLRAKDNVVAGRPYQDFDGNDGFDFLSCENAERLLGRFSPSVLMSHNLSVVNGDPGNGATRKTYSGLSWGFDLAA